MCVKQIHLTITAWNSVILYDIISLFLSNNFPFVPLNTSLRHRLHVYNFGMCTYARPALHLYFWFFFYIGTVCGDRVVRNGNKLTEKLEKLNEVYSQVIASSNLLTKVGCSTSYFSSRRNLVMRVYCSINVTDQIQSNKTEICFFIQRVQTYNFSNQFCYFCKVLKIWSRN